MDDTEEDPYDRRTIVQYVKDTVLAPVRLATSPVLLRTYLRTLLLLLTSSILFGLAVIAYTSFYYAYIPVRGITVPVYLQFDHSASSIPPSGTEVLGKGNKWPYGIANVNGLVSRQKYDVVVKMELPRSERNLQAGNWMLGLEMRGPGTVGGGVKGLLGWDEEWEVDDFSQGGGGDAGTATERTEREAAAAVGAVTGKPVVLARSRRPAILTYRSWTTDLAYRTLRLPLYVFNIHTESETITTHMMESVEFEKGWRNVPSSLRLELRSRSPLEVYKASVKFVARLEGLRWLMYNHRVLSAVSFVSVFWATEMGVLLLTWALFAVFFGAAAEEEREVEEEGKRRIKTESGAATPKTGQGDSEPQTPLSDTSRTFPTLSGQQPLQYTSSSASGDRWKMKEERKTPGLEDIPVKTEAEADDEDDESADFLMEEPLPNTAMGALTDSGIGTSLESSIERSGLSRRKSGGSGKRER